MAKKKAKKNLSKEFTSAVDRILAYKPPARGRKEQREATKPT